MEIIKMNIKNKINTSDLLKGDTIIGIKENKSNLYINFKWVHWKKIPKYILVDSQFVEGVAYCIGDGRTKTKRGLSVVDIDDSAIQSFTH
jgi:hypothetical protein